jgi:integrase
VLGLAWEDLDLDAGTAQIRRGVSYSTSVGSALGSTKTSGAEGIHYLAPISVERLRQRQEEQEAERALMGAEWPEHRYEGEVVSMVFTTSQGGLANRQAVTKEIGRAAKAAGLEPTGLASHSGRRTVVTALCGQGGSTWPMSPDMLDTPIRRRRRATSAASVIARRTLLARQLNCSTRR